MRISRGPIRVRRKWRSMCAGPVSTRSRRESAISRSPVLRWRKLRRNGRRRRLIRKGWSGLTGPKDGSSRTAMCLFPSAAVFLWANICSRRMTISGWNGNLRTGRRRSAIVSVRRRGKDGRRSGSVPTSCADAISMTVDRLVL